nr:ras-related protein Rab-3B isoform X2 [Rattus norvegicus]
MWTDHIVTQIYRVWGVPKKSWISYTCQERRGRTDRTWVPPRGGAWTQREPNPSSARASTLRSRGGNQTRPACLSSTTARCNSPAAVCREPALIRGPAKSGRHEVTDVLATDWLVM